MVGKVVTCTLVFAAVSAAVYAQQVEIPREQSVKAKEANVQGMGDVRPQTVAYAEPPRLTIEQMRQAGAAAGQKVREEEHELDADATAPEPPPPPKKKQIAANAVRPVERAPRES